MSITRLRTLLATRAAELRQPCFGLASRNAGDVADVVEEGDVVQSLISANTERHRHHVQLCGSAVPERAASTWGSLEERSAREAGQVLADGSPVDGDGGGSYRCAPMWCRTGADHVLGVSYAIRLRESR